jgi:hypothetical protein
MTKHYFSLSFPDSYTIFVSIEGDNKNHAIERIFDYDLIKFSDSFYNPKNCFRFTVWQEGEIKKTYPHAVIIEL